MRSSIYNQVQICDYINVTLVLMQQTSQSARFDGEFIDNLTVQSENRGKLTGSSDFNVTSLLPVNW